MRNKDILIIDDDVDLVRMLKAFYSLLPHSFDIVYSGEEALELVKTKNFKVFIIDINLGDNKMHGVDLAILIRKKFEDAKIYALTGHTNLFSNIDPSVAGFDGVFYKPDDYQELLEQISEDLK